MNQLISTRIPGPLVREIKELAQATHLGKTEVLRKVIIQGIQDLKLERALTAYQERKVTVWKASSLAGTSLWEFMEEVKRRKIPVPYTLEDAQREVQGVFG